MPGAQEIVTGIDWLYETEPLAPRHGGYEKDLYA